MAKGLCQLLVIVAIFGATKCALRSLPPYVIQCKRSDPDISKCVTEHGNEIISKLRDGDKEYKISSLNPLKINQATITPSPNFKLTMKDIDVVGLHELRILNTIVTSNDNEFDIRLDTNLPHLKLLGNYEIEGNILVLPITGNGNANITFGNTKVSLNATFGTEEKHNVKTTVVKDLKLIMKTERLYFQFDNLFNGDERLGPEMNKFLNENWMDVHHELEPSFIEIVENVVKNFVTQIVRGVPFDSVFLP